MSTAIRDLLKCVNDDDWLSKLASSVNENDAKPATQTKQAQGTPAPGASTAPAEAPSGAQVTGEVTPGGPSNPLEDQLNAVSANRRVILMDQAMALAGQEQAAAVEAARGAGTDEGHNAGIQPRTGMQEYDVTTAPVSPEYQENYQKQVEDAAGGMAAAAAAGTPKQDAKPEDQEKIAEELAEECIAQGMLVQRGFELGLQKSAESGSLAASLVPSIAAAHEVAFENLAQSPALDKVAEALSEKIAQKLQARLGTK